MMNKITHLSEQKAVLLRPGLTMRNLSYNQQSMLCHFTMDAGAQIELHRHQAVQNGYILRGSVRYTIANGEGQIQDSGVLRVGCGYVWDSNEYHSFEALEDAEFIEHFSPMRPEYVAE